MGRRRGIGDSYGHGLEGLARRKDLAAAGHRLQSHRGSWNRSHRKNLARLVGRRDAGAYLHIPGESCKVQRTIGKPVHVANDTGQTQRCRSLTT